MAGIGRGSLSLGLRNIRRELGSEPAVALSILIAISIASLLITAAPRLLAEVSTEDLYATVSEPDPALRNVRAERFGRFGAGPVDDPLRGIRGYGEAFAENRFPETLQDVVSSQYFLFDSPRFRVEPLPGEDPPHPFRMFLRFRYQQHIEDHVDLVEGAMPTTQEPIEMLLGRECPTDPDEREALRAQIVAGDAALDADDETPLECELVNVPHYQVAVSARTADDMGLEMGRIMLLTPDSTDRLFFGISGQALRYQLAVSISGIIELDDIDDEYWYADDALHRPGIQENADLRIIFATGLITPDDYGSMLSAMGEASREYTWRHFVDPQLVAESDIGALQSDLVPFLASFSPIAARPVDDRVISQLDDLLDSHIKQRSETVAMMSLTVAGLFSVLIAVVALLAVLMTARQRRAVVLTRGRGASGGQIVMSRLLASLLLVVPAGALGYYVSATALPDGEGLIAYRLAVALATAGIACLVLAVVPIARRHLGDFSRDTRLKPSSGARLVLEGLAIVVTVGAILSLRRRGQIDDPTQTTGFDLLLAVTPALVGIAAGVIALRLYPPAVRGLAWVFARTRGAVGFIGFRRVLDGSPARRLPLMVIVICASAAIYATVTLTSISTGQGVSSWQVVGADYSIKGFAADVNLPSSIDFGRLPEVEEAAVARTYSGARLDAGNVDSPTRVIALDAADYARVTEGTPGEVELPSFLSAKPDASIGTPSNPIPVVVASSWPSGMSVSIGATMSLDLGNTEFAVVIRQIRERFPDTTLGDPFVVLSYDSLRAVSEFPTPPTVAYLRAPRSAEDQIRSELGVQAPSARLGSSFDVLDSISQDPFVSWATRALRAIFWAGVLFAAVAAVGSLAIASANRRRDLGYLRTLGLDSSQATTMTAIEQFPPVLIGTTVGALAGVVTALLLAPVVDLDAFTGDLVATPVTVDWAYTALICGGLVAVMTASIVIFVAVSRRDDLGRILRVGDE